MPRGKSHFPWRKSEMPCGKSHFPCGKAKCRAGNRITRGGKAKCRAGNRISRAGKAKCRAGNRISRAGKQNAVREIAFPVEEKRNPARNRFLTLQNRTNSVSGSCSLPCFPRERGQPYLRRFQR